MKRSALIIALLASLAACSNHDHYYDQPQVVSQPQVVVQQPTVVAAPAPVIVQQVAPSSDHLVTGAVLGGALGYMAGRASTPSYHAPAYVDRRPVIVNKTVVVKQYNAPKNVTVVNNSTRITSRPSFAPSSSSRISLSKSSSSFGGFSRRR